MHLPYVAVFFVPILCSIVMVTSMDNTERKLRQELVKYANNDICEYMRSPEDGGPLPQYNEDKARKLCGKAYSAFGDLVHPMATREFKDTYINACPGQSEPYECNQAGKARFRCAWKCDGAFKQLVDILTAAGIQ
nr:PREDICTED: uncharacterized protein LOC109044666 [Bemisia tabaci]